MKYGLSSLERELNPRQIRNAITRVNGMTDLNPRKKSNRKTNDKNKPASEKDREVIQAIIEKFRELFTNEYHRIKDPITANHIEHPSGTFNRYLTGNYRGLIQLENPNEAKKNPGSSCGKPGSDDKDEQSTLSQIFQDLQSLLVIPLKTFIEDGYKELLIENHLFDSPPEIFIKAIKSHQVGLKEHSDLARETYNPIFCPSCRRMFTVEYNGHHVEALYHQSLEEKYEEFKNYLVIYMKSDAGEIEKIRLLNELKTSIAEVENHFLGEIASEGNNFRGIKYRKKEAFDRLSLKLHYFNIQNDTSEFCESLARLTEIQYIFIADSLKFIMDQISLFERCQKLSPVEGTSRKNDKKSEDDDKLVWQANLNQIVGFLDDACKKNQKNGDTFMNATHKQIANFVHKNFAQKNGSSFNIRTIMAILTPSKESKLPPAHKRIIFPDS